MNNQPIQKQVFKVDGKLAVHSVFPTIQGEGPFAGRPATFVRLAGCNLQCPGCDTEYTNPATEVEVSDLVKTIEYQPHPVAAPGRYPLVVITGGEPFRQNIGPLVRTLLDQRYRVQIETNGTLHVPGPWAAFGVHIVCSPKTGRINEELRPYIEAYKYVLDAGNVSAQDGLPVLSMKSQSHIARPPQSFGGTVYVQPLDELDSTKNLRNRNAAIESCLRYGYTLCLQLHKIVGLE